MSWTRAAHLSAFADRGQEIVIPLASAYPEFCLPFTDALPVDHAAIATLGRPFDVETVDASSSVGSRLSELEIDAGEGPGWDAYATRVAVLVPDLAADPPERWPVFAGAVAPLGVKAIYAFPLVVGNLRVGVVELFAHTAHTISPALVADAAALADTAATDVLRHAVDHRFDDDGPHSRREVHQATGMVVAQMRVSASDALLLLRAHAFASGRSVRETAADITSRRISLEP